MNPIYYGLAYNMNGYLAHRSDIFLTPAALGNSPYNSQNIRTYHILKPSPRCIY